ncbi:MAG: hypothetical protein KA010_02820 [Saprospiraceae bacterium]|nr:hypothetical protein [Saprospiraceae bacterium]
MTTISDSILFPAKVLLVGEYAIIKGGEALALPTTLYAGHWVKGERKSSLKPEWSSWLEYLRKHCDDFLDNKLLEEYLINGWDFSANIPHGYGLGSSGALVAAVYMHFAKQKTYDTPLPELKARLGIMESHFHGKSSGFDPLISILNKPIYLIGNEIKTIEKLNWNNTSHSWYLFDIGTPRTTVHLVNQFLEKCNNMYFQEKIDHQLIPLNSEAIHLFLNNQPEKLFETIHEISYFQWQFFSEMIPDSLRQMWLDGLASDNFKMKLCGAGGGGFALCYAKNSNLTQEQSAHLIPLHF